MPETTAPAGSTATDSTLARIRGLLAKAESTSFEHEAESFRAKAFELMARHAVDEALVSTPAQADEMGEQDIDLDGAYGDARAALLSGIGRAMSVYTMLTTRRGARTPYKVTLFGRQSDRERVELLYTSLLLQATNQVVRVQPEEGWDRPSDVRRARRSWFYGFAWTVEERLTEKFAEAAAGTGAELVLADRTKVAQAFANERHVIGKPIRRTVGDASAAAAGREAGQRADLGTSRLAGRAVRQLGG